MKTLKAAVFGRTLAHSISPEVHNEIFEIMRRRIPTEYQAIQYGKVECENEDEFRFQVQRGTEWGFVGINVTIPYKQLAARMARDKDSSVRSITSANTIRFGLSFTVASTDGPGFCLAIAKECPDLNPSEFRFVLLGAGGAARAVFHSIRDMGWRKITVAVRSIEEAKMAYAEYPHVEVIPLGDLTRDDGAQLIVHATPVGQQSDEHLIEAFDWRSGDIAVDLVYNPIRTRFLDRAAEHGATTISGLGMLLEQAALSQHLWLTGRESKDSMLTNEEYATLKESMSKILTPAWDAFAS